MAEIINYLGVDWGEKRIGLATASSDVCLALPLKTVGGIRELKQVIIDEEINVIVLGEPTKMGGAQANNPLWLNFYNKIKKVIDCQIEVYDERLSSLAADSLEGTKKQKAGRDEIAAAIILQDYLERKL